TTVEAVLRVGTAELRCVAARLEELDDVPLPPDSNRGPRRYRHHVAEELPLLGRAVDHPCPRVGGKLPLAEELREGPQRVRGFEAVAEGADHREDRAPEHEGQLRQSHPPPPPSPNVK